MIKRNGFNRYIVECKASPFLHIQLATRDLIDTLWNVKSLLDLMVLGDRFGFNRYIVECKDHARRHRRYYGGGDLIDTLWNVKTLEVFRENMVEGI